MDQTTRPAETESMDTGEPAVSRRRFFNRARLGLIAVAGIAVFGVATSTAGVIAKEDEDKEKKEKDEKSKPRDKDREAKEKEKESKNKDEENGSNTKEKKNKNGDDSKKKKKNTNEKKNDPIASSPHGKYIVKGEDKYGCTAFPNQAEAQAVLRLEPKDPNNLDGNRDGVACDGSDAFMDGVPEGLMQPPFDINRVARP